MPTGAISMVRKPLLILGLMNVSSFMLGLALGAFGSRFVPWFRQTFSIATSGISDGVIERFMTLNTSIREFSGFLLLFIIFLCFVNLRLRRHA
jgi:hypothetical protein